MIVLAGVSRTIYLAIVLSLLSPLAATAGLTPDQTRGRQIYTKGTSPSGDEINAIMGNEGVTLPASTAPCASCHGPDGLGRREGEIIPPDIRWSELTKSYGHIHDDGRKHPAFNDVNVARVIRTGLDPASNRLFTFMPLYTLSERDMDSLVAYLKVLEHDMDPGIEKDHLLVGTLLPLQGQHAATGQAMARVMHAYISEINARGGVFGRKLELLAIPYGDTVNATMHNLRSAFEQERIFAMVGAYTIGLDEPVQGLLRDLEVPLLGPFTLNPGDAFVDSRIFYLYPGFSDQALALLELAMSNQPEGERRLLVVGPEVDHIDVVVEAVESRKSANSADGIEIIRYQHGEMQSVGMVDQLQKAGCDAMLFLGNQSEFDEMIAELDNRHLYPRVYLLSVFVTRPLFDAPLGFDNRFFLAYPTLAHDISDKGRSEYQRLAETYELPQDHVQAQISALAAIKLFEEGLRGTGRNLSRMRLVEALEHLYRYETGLTPPLTYGPNRRVGARGAWILAIDLANRKSVPVGQWHELHY